MIQALLIRTDNSLVLFEYDPRDPGSLDLLHEKIGGWLEAAPICLPELTMYCDEEGKLKGRPLNLLATFLLDPRAQDVIVGDAVLVGAPDGEGYDTSLPDLAALRGGGDEPA